MTRTIGPAQQWQDLPLWLWAFFPLLMLLLLAVAAAIGPEYASMVTRSDHDPEGTGVAEHATVIVLLPGIIAGFSVIRRWARLPDARLGWWVLAWTLACIYFAGEEVSWGQHYFGWQSPEMFQALNRQGETNLHNISSWFDRKPRALVELWVMLGGLGVPAWRRWRGYRSDPDRLSDWILPSNVVAPTAALFLVFRVHNWISDATGFSVATWLSESEVREYYIALFLSLYLLSIWKRLLAPR